MSKRILVVILTILLIFVGLLGYKYYQDTYVGEVAYSLTPSSFPEKKLVEGSQGIYQYVYTLKFVKQNGLIETRTFCISGENPIALPLNTPIKAEISAKRVTKGPEVVSISEVPSSLRVKLTN